MPPPPTICGGDYDFLIWHPGAIEGSLIGLRMLGISTGKNGRIVASDLFVRGALPEIRDTPEPDFDASVRANRFVCWEDELGSLLDSGIVTANAARKVSKADWKVREFLAQRRAVKKEHPLQ